MSKRRWYHKLFQWRTRTSEKDAVQKRNQRRALKTPPEKKLMELAAKGELFWGPQRIPLSPVSLQEVMHDVLSGQKRVYVMRERPDGSFKYMPVRSPAWQMSAYRRWLIHVRKEPSIKLRHFSSLSELEKALPRKVYYFNGQIHALDRRLSILDKQIEIEHEKGKTPLLESLIWSRNATQRKRNVIVKWSKEARACMNDVRLYKNTLEELEHSIERETFYSKEAAQLSKLTQPDLKVFSKAKIEIRMAIVRQVALRVRLLAEEIDIYEKYGYSFSGRKFADLVRAHESLQTSLLQLAHHVHKRNKRRKKKD